MSLFNSINILKKLNISIGIQSIDHINIFDPSHYCSHLNSTEEDIFNSIKFEKRKLEWVAGRLAAKKAYAEFCKKNNLNEFENVTILNSDNRAPYIKEYPDIQLSITHSNEFAFAAASYNQIGIDLESIHSGSPALLKYFFTDKESKFILDEAKTDEQLKASITKYWTRKEAIAKYLKLGMKMNFRLLDTTTDNVSVANNSNELIKLLTYKMNDYYLSVAT